MKWNDDPVGMTLVCKDCGRRAGKHGPIEKILCPACRAMRLALDGLFESFAYVREIGRGGNNHIGIELTVSFGKNKSPEIDDREGVKDFLMQAINSHELQTEGRCMEGDLAGDGSCSTEYSGFDVCPKDHEQCAEYDPTGEQE